MSDVVRVSQSQPSDRCKPRLGHVTLKDELWNASVTLHTLEQNFCTFRYSELFSFVPFAVSSNYFVSCKVVIFFHKLFYARNLSSIVAVVTSRTNASNTTLQVIVRCLVLAVFYDVCSCNKNE